MAITKLVSSFQEPKGGGVVEAVAHGSMAGSTEPIGLGRGAQLVEVQHADNVERVGWCDVIDACEAPPSHPNKSKD